jgi:hypothetical protein
MVWLETTMRRPGRPDRIAKQGPPVAAIQMVAGVATFQPSRALKLAAVGVVGRS